MEQETLSVLRKRLSVAEKAFLDECWNHFATSENWPLTRITHSRHGKQEIRALLKNLGGSIVYEFESHREGNCYHLTFLGILLTSKGEGMQSLVSRYFDYCRKLYTTEPAKMAVSSAEAQEKLQLDPKQTQILGKLIFAGNLFAHSGSHGPDAWHVGIIKEVEDFPREGDLTGEVERWALRNYDRNTVVFVDERHLANTSAPQALVNPLAVDSSSDSAPDPLKRRYQVFVSSTYEDLKDERRHVMQTLLETKCIPAGMELFPAASEEQWTLIKRVIDDCDYYIVIVAGRYGSLGKEGKSYTEMEFDHAVASGAYVMGFYHVDVESLPLAKSEKGKLAQRRLAEFAAKVKKTRVCKSWSTPEGLSLAIKSAIFHAIEHHPKPGWVRARDVASPAAIAKLRASVERTKFAAGNDTVELPAEIGYNEVDDPDQRYHPWSTRKRFPHVVRLTWNQIFLTLAPRLNERKNRRALKIIFENQLSPQLEGLIPKQSGKHIVNPSCSVDTNVFERVLDTFVADKLLQVVQPPKDVRSKVPYWEMTAKGRQRLAELRATPST